MLASKITGYTVAQEALSPKQHPTTIPPPLSPVIEGLLASTVVRGEARLVVVQGQVLGVPLLGHRETQLHHALQVLQGPVALTDTTQVHLQPHLTVQLQGGQKGKG